MTTIWQEALERIHGNDLLQLGMDADAVRQKMWPERVVTYTVGCPLRVGSVDRTAEAEAAVERGARGFVLHAEAGADLNRIVTELASLHARFPQIVLTGFSTEEIEQLSKNSPILYTLVRLREAGLAALGPDVADDSASWRAAHRAAHPVGLKSTAAILLRSHESDEQWVARLEDLVRLQEETHGFIACEPRIEHLERPLDEVTGVRYLQFVALTRLYLVNVPHIQADWSIFGPKVLQLALRFGADDAGLVFASERDPKTPSHHSGEEELRRTIRDAGFTPVERDAVYGRQFV